MQKQSELTNSSDSSVDHRAIIQNAENIAKELEERLSRIENSRRYMIGLMATAGGILMTYIVYTEADNFINLMLVSLFVLVLVFLSAYISVGLEKKRNAIKERLAIIRKHLTTDT